MARTKQPNIKGTLEEALKTFIEKALAEDLTIEDEVALQTYLEMARIYGTETSTTLAMAEALLSDIKENA